MSNTSKSNGGPKQTNPADTHNINSSHSTIAASATSQSSRTTSGAQIPNNMIHQAPRKNDIPTTHPVHAGLEVVTNHKKMQQPSRNHQQHGSTSDNKGNQTSSGIPQLDGSIDTSLLSMSISSTISNLSNRSKVGGETTADSSHNNTISHQYSTNMNNTVSNSSTSSLSNLLTNNSNNSSNMINTSTDTSLTARSERGPLRMGKSNVGIGLQRPQHGPPGGQQQQQQQQHSSSSNQSLSHHPLQPTTQQSIYPPQPQQHLSRDAMSLLKSTRRAAAQLGGGTQHKVQLPQTTKQPQPQAPQQQPTQAAQLQPQAADPTLDPTTYPAQQEATKRKRPVAVRADTTKPSHSPHPQQQPTTQLAQSTQAQPNTHTDPTPTIQPLTTTAQPTTTTTTEPKSTPKHPPQRSQTRQHDDNEYAIDSAGNPLATPVRCRPLQPIPFPQVPYTTTPFQHSQSPIVPQRNNLSHHGNNGEKNDQNFGQNLSKNGQNGGQNGQHLLQNGSFHRNRNCNTTILMTVAEDDDHDSNVNGSSGTVRNEGDESTTILNSTILNSSHTLHNTGGPNNLTHIIINQSTQHYPHNHSNNGSITHNPYSSDNNNDFLDNKNHNNLNNLDNMSNNHPNTINNDQNCITTHDITTNNGAITGNQLIFGTFDDSAPQQGQVDDQSGQGDQFEGLFDFDVESLGDFDIGDINDDFLADIEAIAQDLGVTSTYEDDMTLGGGGGDDEITGIYDQTDQTLQNSQDNQNYDPFGSDYDQLGHISIDSGHSIQAPVTKRQRQDSTARFSAIQIQSDPTQLVQLGTDGRDPMNPVDMVNIGQKSVQRGENLRNRNDQNFHQTVEEAQENEQLPTLPDPSHQGPYCNDTEHFHANYDMAHSYPSHLYPHHHHHPTSSQPPQYHSPPHSHPSNDYHHQQLTQFQTLNPFPHHPIPHDSPTSTTLLPTINLIHSTALQQRLSTVHTLFTTPTRLQLSLELSDLTVEQHTLKSNLILLKSLRQSILQQFASILPLITNTTTRSLYHSYSAQSSSNIHLPSSSSLLSHPSHLRSLTPHDVTILHYPQQFLTHNPQLDSLSHLNNNTSSINNKNCHNHNTTTSTSLTPFLNPSQTFTLPISQIFSHLILPSHLQTTAMALQIGLDSLKQSISRFNSLKIHYISTLYHYHITSISLKQSHLILQSANSQFLIWLWLHINFLYKNFQNSIFSINIPYLNNLLPGLSFVSPLLMRYVSTNRINQYYCGNRGNSDDYIEKKGKNVMNHQTPSPSSSNYPNGYINDRYILLQSQLTAAAILCHDFQYPFPLLLSKIFHSLMYSTPSYSYQYPLILGAQYHPYRSAFNNNFTFSPFPLRPHDGNNDDDDGLENIDDIDIESNQSTLSSSSSSLLKFNDFNNFNDLDQSTHYNPHHHHTSHNHNNTYNVSNHNDFDYNQHHQYNGLNYGQHHSQNSQSLQPNSQNFHNFSEKKSSNSSNPSSSNNSLMNLPTIPTPFTYENYIPIGTLDRFNSFINPHSSVKQLWGTISTFLSTLGTDPHYRHSLGGHHLSNYIIRHRSELNFPFQLNRITCIEPYLGVKKGGFGDNLQNNEQNDQNNPKSLHNISLPTPRNQYHLPLNPSNDEYNDNQFNIKREHILPQGLYGIIDTHYHSYLNQFIVSQQNNDPLPFTRPNSINNTHILGQNHLNNVNTNTKYSFPQSSTTTAGGSSPIPRLSIFNQPILQPFLKSPQYNFHSTSPLIPIDPILHSNQVLVGTGSLFEIANRQLHESSSFSSLYPSFFNRPIDLMGLIAGGNGDGSGSGSTTSGLFPLPNIASSFSTNHTSASSTPSSETTTTTIPPHLQTLTHSLLRLPSLNQEGFNTTLLRYLQRTNTFVITRDDFILGELFERVIGEER